MIDMNGNIVVGGPNCVVSDTFCYDWSPCKYCKQERERLFSLRQKRHENEVLAAEAVARRRSNEALAQVMVENPGTTLGVLGVFAGAALAAAVINKNRNSKKGR
jgi:hypothetical protein